MHTGYKQDFSGNVQPSKFSLHMFKPTTSDYGFSDDVQQP